MGVVLSIEEVLAAEADEIHGKGWQTELTLRNQDALQPRAWLNADDRDSTRLPAGEKEDREKLYRALNKLNRAALCFSGGGIRSATFCLGVLQALADYDVTHPVPKPHHAAPADPHSQASIASHAGGESLATVSPKGEEKPAIKPEMKPENSLLGCFHYLSTVSGGGYVGSWLSSWRHRDDFPTIIRNLTGRPDGADVESPEVSWLRAYSNYLTPRRGIASADTWAAVAIVVRNLILNWLVIIPVVCIALLGLQFVAAASVRAAESQNHDCLLISIGAAGVIFLIAAQAFTTRHRPTRRLDEDNVYERTFLWRDLIWSIVSAFSVTIFFTSRYFSWRFLEWIDSAVQRHGVTQQTKLLVLAAAAGLLIYSVGWIAGLRFRRGWRDFFYWAASGLVYGALIGLGVYLFSLLGPYPSQTTTSTGYLPLLLAVIFGVPWVLMAQLLAEVIFVGLASYEDDSDSDREWLGRAAGWLITSAVAWALTAALVFAGAYFASQMPSLIDRLIVALGGAAGIVSALLGSSAKTAANAMSDKGDRTGKIYNVVLAVAGPLFGAVLVIVLSIGLDKLLLDGSLLELLRLRSLATGYILLWLFIGLVTAAAIAGLASYFININRFSLHALYRNRLIRAYLGASRQERHPDLFTGFDVEDNVRVHEIWPPKSDGDINSRKLFHVINIALNVVSTKRKAWQQRKAEPFTVSPLHCGSAYLGFRPSAEYGDRPHKDRDNDKVGISLGTAMAISGAAVSPNMGYHSSPSIALLLTLFNVRLGWWLGNPGQAGDKTYQSEGPSVAAKPLFDEAFGQTTDQRPYVYLSDGGHFENLGLYEMVRRRCRFIIVVDASCDPKFGFEDLGNAVRKIYIDLGVTIDFEGLDRLRNRPSPETVLRDFGNGPIPYCAIGTIDYKNADGVECENGSIIYIKPAYHDANEGAGIRSYAKANPTFPHESTADQWFTESQFESYRSLGMEIAQDVLNNDVNARRILSAFLAKRRGPQSSPPRSSNPTVV